MDLLTFVISVALLGFAVQLGELWIVLGATCILILAARDFKASILFVLSVFVLYFVNGIGMKEYWIVAVFALLIVAYLLGLGKEEAPQDPYAGLLGGMGGGMP
ncbi:MAG: hypothetical protein WCI04_05405 [archaeon]